jgi:hypothetical protein
MKDLNVTVQLLMPKIMQAHLPSDVTYVLCNFRVATIFSHDNSIL